MLKGQTKYDETMLTKELGDVISPIFNELAALRVSVRSQINLTLAISATALIALSGGSWWFYSHIRGPAVSSIRSIGNKTYIEVTNAKQVDAGPSGKPNSTLIEITHGKESK